MSNSLTLAYEFSNDPKDDFGWLVIAAEGNGFAGTAGYWVQWQDVVEWAAMLDAFPLPSSGIKREWGYTEEGTYYQVIYIGLSQSTPGGRLSVSLGLRDYYDRSLHAEFCFETSYSRLAEFKAEVERLMAGTSEGAMLLGD